MKHPDRTRHYYLACLVARTAAFALLIVYAVCAPDAFSAGLAAGPLYLSPLTILWWLLMLSMAIRFFPSRMESMGCQKEFASRFRPTGKPPSPEEVHKADLGALWELLSWAAVNALFFLAHWRGWINDRFMVCLTGFYGVCDIICILFFCPFQVWMMHNRCCATCRIYNWDYLMMCTPLMCLDGFLAAAACGMALVLFLRWEITYLRRRERFFQSANEALRCDQCQEHLCAYKRAMARKSLPRRSRQ